MSVDTDLHVGAGVEAADFRSTDGVHQGADDAMLGFSAAIHDLIKNLDRQLGALGVGEARFFVDDGLLLVDPSAPGVAAILLEFEKGCRVLGTEEDLLLLALPLP